VATLFLGVGDRERAIALVLFENNFEPFSDEMRLKQ